MLTTQMLQGLILIFSGLNIPSLGVSPPMRSIVFWVAQHILGISHPIAYRSTGSGDKLFDFVHAFTLLLVAVIATAVWSAVDRQRPHHARLSAWFRLFIRLALGTTMLTYGFSKVIPLQMPVLTLSRLVEPFGNFSPMGVLWSSIGASGALAEALTSLSVGPRRAARPRCGAATRACRNGPPRPRAGRRRSHSSGGRGADRAGFAHALCAQPVGRARDGPFQDSGTGIRSDRGIV